MKVLVLSASSANATVFVLSPTTSSGTRIEYALKTSVRYGVEVRYAMKYYKITQYDCSESRESKLVQTRLLNP